MSVKSKVSNVALEVLDMIRTVIICVICVFICTTVLFKPVRVEGDSMKPTLLDGEYGLSNVFSVLNGDINRFDVVVVKSKNDDNLWVKRVIGLPNETIEYREGKLYIDGAYVEETFLDEAYVLEMTNGNADLFTADFGPIKVGENQVFLVGDNRGVSLDSRMVGCFEMKSLVSKSVFIYYPFNKMRVVSNGTK